MRENASFLTSLSLTLGVDVRFVLIAVFAVLFFVGIISAKTPTSLDLNEDYSPIEQSIGDYQSDDFSLETNARK